jgi:radical SAM superfamily enzyme YgiQ (UPF0313 family)
VTQSRTVGLAQINMGLTWATPRTGEAADYGLLPYSTGLLQAYAEEHASTSLEFVPPLYARMPVEAGARALAGVDVAGFSTYVWNINLSLAIARRLKELSPETLVVFGGPQVPDRAEGWLRDHPQVDVAVHGEGEAAFARILDGETGVPGTTTRDGHTLPAPRINDMTTIPSPYLSGTFAPLLEQGRWAMMWETNRGCPFSCAFCDWGSATASKVYRFEIERLLAEIEWLAEHEIEFVFCCDANFGMLPRDLDIARAIVDSKRSKKFPAMFSVQNTKNAVDRAYEVQTLLATEMNYLGVTIALQSTSPTTLEAIKRQNISSEAFAELQRRFAAAGTYTYTDLIVGLPGEPYPTFANSISDVIDGGQHNHVQFHDCSVLPNAEMGHPDYIARYGIETAPQLIPTTFVPMMAGDEAWEDEVPEYLDLVVATKDLPRADWARARALAWAADLFYFDRLLQIPLLVLSRATELRVHELIEALLEADSPELTWVSRTLHDKARAVQDGESSYVTGERAWMPDQHVLVELVAGERIDALYREAREVLAALTGEETLTEDCVELNRALLRLPFRTRDAWLALDGNVWERYSSLIAGEPVPFEPGVRFYRVNNTSRSWPTLEAWYDHLLRCQKDKRVYLQSLQPARAAAAA